MRSKYELAGRGIGMQEALSVLEQLQGSAAPPGDQPHVAGHGDSGYEVGEAGAALVGPARLEGCWSAAIATFTHGAQATRLYKLHDLLAVEEENEREREIERGACCMSAWGIGSGGGSLESPG
jgi:hypothetical protein